MIITHNNIILKNEGIILNKITTVPPTPPPPFVNTYSLSFDGVDDYLDLGASSTVANGGQFSLSFWVKGTSQSIGAKYLFSADYYNLHTFWTIQNTELYWRTINNNYKLLSTNLLDGDWHHILIIWNPDGANSTIRCFTDGTNEVNIATDYRYGNGGIYQGGLQYIGNRGGGTFPGFNGSIDEFAVWDNDQSANISSIYNGGTPTDLSLLATPPLHWYRNGDNGSWKSPQWLIPNNENKDKVSNYSFEFDGTDDRVQLSSDFVASGEFTLSFWMKPVAVTGNGNIFPIGTFPDNQNHVRLDQIGVMYLKVQAVLCLFNEGVVGGGANNLVLNEWQHISFIRDSSNVIRCYRNGARFGQTATNSGTLTLNSIGRVIANTFGFQGGLNEIAYWNSDETANLSIIYNGGEPTTISGAIAHYRMGEEANFTSNWLVDNSISPNRALKFDNTYITAPPWSGYQGLLASTTAISSDHITLSTWFNSTDSGNSQGEIFKTSLYGIKVYANRVYLNKAGALYRYWNSSSLFNGSWHNIIIYIPNTTTWDLADAKIYVDSADLGAGTGINDGTGVPQITDIYGLFKTGGGGGGTMTAEISNWAYWLSDKRDEVSTIYNNGMPGDLSSLSPDVWWKLDSGTVTTDTQVDVIDSSGNNVTGTGPRNAAKTIPALVSSIVNSRPPYSKRSFAFDGIDDKIELGNPTDLQITGAFSFSCWVNTTSTNYEGIYFKGNSVALSDIYIRRQNNGTVRFFINNVSKNVTSSTTVNDGNWHHIMCVYVPSTSMTIYIDGSQDAQNTTTIPSAINNNYGNISIGEGGGQFFNGKIDEASIFNTDQSANVSTIYNSGIPNDLTPLSPVAWYRMGEDASFNGTNWTVPDNAGTNTGTSANMTVDDLVGEAPNYSGGGISNGMTIEDRVGEAPNSENNVLSINMEREDRIEDTP